MSTSTSPAPPTMPAPPTPAGDERPTARKSGGPVADAFGRVGTGPSHRSRVRARTVVFWFVVFAMVMHGLLHLLGAAKGLGWSPVTQLTEPISTAMGLAWLMAAALVVTTGVLLAIRVRWWWMVGAVAVLVSQAVIFTSWGDAKVGTGANLVLLVAVVYGYASQGPRSLRYEYRRRALVALAEPLGIGVVTEADLKTLPTPVADYVRRSGAGGQPHVTNFHARFHGRIRAGADKTWMTYEGEQVNTFGPEPSRLFFMDATMFGLPVDVLHAFVGPSATMRVRACSLVPMVNASGPDMDRAETVTLFNDMCILAPAALVDAPIVWREIDDCHTCGTFTNGAQSVTAVLVFNDDHDLIDFISGDRRQASADGKTFTDIPWSTPIRGYRPVGLRRVGTIGEGRWHPPEGEFAYLEFHLDQISYNASVTGALGSSKRTRRP
jgi:Family of unknown function (DUF6544)